ncbi:MAG: response regulator [Elusimicrobiota bacterium]|nr:response regulator [Elusimicrobiota bacterium]
MKKTLLVADDDKDFQRIITRLFEGTEWKVEAAEDGVTALERIAVQPPDIILLDLNMPRLGGRELLARIRKTPGLAMIPVIIISGDDGPQEQACEFWLGADDFISKPFNALELVSRVEGAARRARRMLGANPLTHLPGSPAIEEEVARRVAAGGSMAFFYIDIDNFKSYNDGYGYLNGDNAIKRTAALLSGVREDFSGEDVFLGHIGGDDFVMISAPGKAEEIARAIAARFDALAPGFYSAEDEERGFIVSKDRSGEIHEFPLMTLSIAIATNEKMKFSHYARIVDTVGEIKKYLKALKGRSGSVYYKDKRGD